MRVIVKKRSIEETRKSLRNPSTKFLYNGLIEIFMERECLDRKASEIKAFKQLQMPLTRVQVDRLKMSILEFQIKKHGKNIVLGKRLQKLQRKRIV